MFFPCVPVIVRDAVPFAAVLAAVRVSTLEVLVEVGERDAVTPLGSPEMARETLPAAGVHPPTEMVSVAVAPGASCRVLLAV